MFKLKPGFIGLVPFIFISYIYDNAYFVFLMAFIFMWKKKHLNSLLCFLVVNFSYNSLKHANSSRDIHKPNTVFQSHGVSKYIIHLKKDDTSRQIVKYLVFSQDKIIK